MSRPTKCLIDLTKLKNNYLSIKKYTSKKVVAMVKADAYGHGLSECAKALADIDADYLGIACAEEGEVIRNAGITVPIICVGPLPPGSAEATVKFDIQQAVSSVNDLKILQEEAVKQNKICFVHIKIETGMHRTGIRPGDELNKMLQVLKQLSNVRLSGVFTHLSCADAADEAYTFKQRDLFLEAVEQIKAFGFTDFLTHCANSGAICRYKGFDFDMVRAGIVLYGYYPDNCVCSLRVEPVLTFITQIVAINKIYKGESISYGATFTAEKDMTVAVIPVGYGDGYKRSVSNKGYVLICGQKAPVCGRVCMDMTVVDVSSIPNATVSSPVTLIGEGVSADTVASWCDTISYEIMLSITPRIPKIYVG